MLCCLRQSFPHKAARGFTLVEVMVAMAVFAVIAAGVYRVLSAMVETQDKIVTHSESLRDLQRAMWLLSADMRQLVMRDITEANEDRSPALIADDDYLLQFTRQGLRNPLLFNRSDLQRVAYSLGPDPAAVDEDGRRRRSDDSQHLLRHTWSAVDRTDDTVEVVQVLLRDVEEVNITFLDEDGDWKKTWPEKKMDDKAHIRQLPEAIRLTLTTKKYGNIERLFQTGNVIDKKKTGQKDGAP